MADDVYECTFVVKETADGQPFVQIEPEIENANISLQLRPDTPIEVAAELSKHMRQHIVSISIRLREPNIQFEVR
jgi:hypothetical protein